MCLCAGSQERCIIHLTPKHAMCPQACIQRPGADPHHVPWSTLCIGKQGSQQAWKLNGLEFLNTHPILAQTPLGFAFLFCHFIFYLPYFISYSFLLTINIINIFHKKLKKTLILLLFINFTLFL